MDAKDIELVKSIIEAAIKTAFEAQTSGMVPFAWVSVIVGGLVAGIGVTWAWGLKQSTKASEEIKGWATKVQELADKQRDRDDDRDIATRDRWEKVVKGIHEKHTAEKAEWKVREKRLEDSRDAAKLQYETTLRDNGEILTKQIVECNSTISEATEYFELLVPIIQRTESGS